MFGELFAAVCVLAAAAAACPSHELESDQKTYEGGGGLVWTIHAIYCISHLLHLCTSLLVCRNKVIEHDILHAREIHNIYINTYEIVHRNLDCCLTLAFSPVQLCQVLHLLVWDKHLHNLNKNEDFSMK